MKKGEDHIGVSVIYWCHDGQGNVLMHKRSKNCRDEHGCWDCGGGALEFGEKVEDNIKKEIAEEYGTDVLKYDFLGYRDVHREHEGKKTHWVALDFKVLIDRAKVKNGEPHKFETVEWFKMNALPNPLHSQLGIFLDLHKGKLY